jgi:hypothetical protein
VGRSTDAIDGSIAAHGRSLRSFVTT